MGIVVIQGTGCRRRDNIHAAYVHAAVTIDELQGRDRAVAFLRREGISPNTIRRVLDNPNCRRPPKSGPRSTKRLLYLVHCPGY